MNLVAPKEASVSRSRFMLVALFVAACSGATPSSSAPTVSGATQLPLPPTASAAPSPTGDAIDGIFTVDGRRMYLSCKGSGAPTVILEAGHGGNSSTWATVSPAIAPTTRTCRYDRAGLGASAAIPGAGDLSAGDRAAGLHALLDVAGVEGPHVLVGFSYGGMIVRTFAARYPSEVAGVVFVDATHEEAWAPGSWFLEQFPLGSDGAHRVDMARTRDELLAATDLGDRPTTVLTQGTMNGEFERLWSPIQDALAAMSSNSLHMVATDSGDDIPHQRQALVVESIIATVEAVRGTPLPACGPRFETLGAECLAGTLAELLAEWDAQRDAFVPAAGKLPKGAYSFKEGDGAVITMTVDGGRLGVHIKGADGTIEQLTAEYAAVKDKVTFLWPFDWRIPRTPGVNLARWTVDLDGTLHFVQLDTEQTESWIAAPWVPVTGE